MHSSTVSEGGSAATVPDAGERLSRVAAEVGLSRRPRGKPPPPPPVRPPPPGRLIGAYKNVLNFLGNCPIYEGEGEVKVGFLHSCCRK
jgi:hypothetical protein